MTDWQRLLWLGEMSFSLGLLTWPVPLGLFAAAFAIQTRNGTLTLPGPLRLWSIVVPVVIPAVILAVGTAWACQNCSPSALGAGVRYEWASTAASLLLLAHLGVVAWLIFRSPGRRGATAVVQCALFWCSLNAAIIAGMSISGDWL